MQFTLSNLAARPDVERIERALTDLDPAAIADFDDATGTLRMSTLLEPSGIAQALADAGLPVAPDTLRRQPSECCGGCGG